MTSSVLTITSAQKRFGETEALRGAQLDLARGEWLGLLGPNGAGKTTLVRAVAGRVRLDRGEITLLGQTLANNGADTAAARSKLGVVPQDIALYPRLTARENLWAWGRLHGVDRSALSERVAWALEWTGLSERGKQLVETFSGGMKRRLNIACGVLHRPEVILLDEPTVGVDPQSRVRIWEMLRQLQQDGASLLLTTHQLDEAQQVCERIVIVDHGDTIAAGTFDELVEQTLGRGRRVAFQLADPPGEIPEGFSAGAEGAGSAEHVVSSNSKLGGSPAIGNDRYVSCLIEDIAIELPNRLTRLADAGHVVMDVEVTAPSLQAVFIHLTGRELRE